MTHPICPLALLFSGFSMFCPLFSHDESVQVRPQVRPSIRPWIILSHGGQRKADSFCEHNFVPFKLFPINYSWEDCDVSPSCLFSPLLSNACAALQYILSCLFASIIFFSFLFALSIVMHAQLYNTSCLFASVFLDASSHLYKRVCPAVCPSVRPSVHP